MAFCLYEHGNNAIMGRQIDNKQFLGMEYPGDPPGLRRQNVLDRDKQEHRSKVNPIFCFWELLTKNFKVVSTLKLVKN